MVAWSTGLVSIGSTGAAPAMSTVAGRPAGPAARPRSNGTMSPAGAESFAIDSVQPTAPATFRAVLSGTFRSARYAAGSDRSEGVERGGGAGSRTAGMPGRRCRPRVHDRLVVCPSRSLALQSGAGRAAAPRRRQLGPALRVAWPPTQPAGVWPPGPAAVRVSTVPMLLASIQSHQARPDGADWQHITKSNRRRRVGATGSPAKDCWAASSTSAGERHRARALLARV